MERLNVKIIEKKPQSAKTGVALFLPNLTITSYALIVRVYAVGAEILTFVMVVHL